MSTTGQTKRKSPSGGKDTGGSSSKRKSPGGKDVIAGASSSSSSSFSKKKSKPSPSTSSSKSTSTNKAPTTASGAVNKRQLKQERQSTRKHADIVQEAKAIWNQLRLKTNTKDDTIKLMEQLMPLMTGKMTEIALQHDASRCVQAALQFGNAPQRRLIVTELTATPGNLAELSKSLYAQFVVLKMIQYCCSGSSNGSNGNGKNSKDDYDECVVKITRNLKGHVVKMATHAVASKIVESLFRTLLGNNSNSKNKQIVAVLKQEFYGPHFSLFAASDLHPNQTNTDKDSKTPTAKKIPDLESNLALVPEKKQQTLEFVSHLLHTCMEKSLYGHEYFQTLLAEYCSVASPVEIRQLSSSGGAVSHNAIHLLASRAGTRALCQLIAYATAKDRKAMLKSIKGYARSGLLHKDAYLAILRLVQLTDDTVVVQKNLLQELVTTPTKNSKDNVIVKDSSKDQKKDEKQPDDSTKQDSPLLEICTSETGSKLFLMLLPNPETQPGAWRKYFDPYELSVLFENPTIPSSSSSSHDSIKLDKTASTEEPTSKKNPILKRQELLDNCLREPLLQLCCLHTEDLLRSRPGCAVLREVYQAFTPKTTELVQAVVDACVASLNSGNEIGNDGDDKAENDEDDSTPLPLLEDRIGHLAIKNLLLLDATATSTTESSSSSSMFATQFMDRLGDRLMDIAQANRGAFVVAALCKVPSVRKSAIGKLDQKRLQELSKHENVPTAGFEALLKEIKSL